MCIDISNYTVHFTYSIYVIGRQYDKDGNLVQWWSDQVIAAFKEKAQCIIDQYSNYTVEEVSMNVSHTKLLLVQHYTLCFHVESIYDQSGMNATK